MSARREGPQIGDLVRSTRESLGLSLRAVAAERGVSPSVQSHLENATDVRLDTLLSFTEAVGATLTVSFSHPGSRHAVTGSWGPQFPSMLRDLQYDQAKFIRRCARALAGRNPALEDGISVVLTTFMRRFWSNLEDVDDEGFPVLMDTMGLSAFEEEQICQNSWRGCMRDAGSTFDYKSFSHPELTHALITRFNITPASEEPPKLEGDVRELMERDPDIVFAFARWDTLAQLSRYAAYFEAGMPEFDEALRVVHETAEDEHAMNAFWAAIGHDLTHLTEGAS